MKKAFNKKKGFTIVELVIVVAVIGVLTAILVPTFVNLTNKANEASNQAFVKNLNTAMAMREAEEGKNKTMSEAVEDAKMIGFDVEKLTPVNGRDLVWDSVSNRFLLLEPNGDVWFGKEDKKATDDVQIWKIYDAMPTTQKFSIYAKHGFGEVADHLTVGFDAGSEVVKTVNYEGTKSVVLNTKNDLCVITIDAPLADVDFYGFAKEINVKHVKGASLHVYGSVNELAVESGHVQIEDTGIVFDVTQIGAADTGEGASVTNNGYVAEVSLSGNTTTEAKTKAAESAPTNVGGDYAIGSREKLEAFRNAVNAGNNFEDFDGSEKKVKLTADITLRDGWTPIGEGSRKVAGTRADGTGIESWFKGFFDGQGHKISNLNNKGFEPNEKRLTAVGKTTPEKQYVWGLFGLVGDGAKFSNITFENVDFDGDRFTGAVADSVGALIGYAEGSLSVVDVTVNGSIKGSDAISGVVGRIAVFGGTVLVSGCKNNATITANHPTQAVASGIIRMYRWAAGNSATLINNENTGTVTGTIAGGISAYEYKGDAERNLTISGNTNLGAAATDHKAGTQADKTGTYIIG